MVPYSIITYLQLRVPGKFIDLLCELNIYLCVSIAHKVNLFVT